MEDRKNVVIWGGTSGLGRELSLRSVERGHATVVTGRIREGEVGEDIRSLNERGIKFIAADFHRAGDPAGVDFVGRGFYAASLNADILFWVVGHWLPLAPFWEQPPEKLLELHNVHLLVPLLRLQYVLKLRIADGGRPIHLVTVSSSSSWKTRDDGQATYGAIQAAKAQFTRNLARELAAALPGSRTTLICPSGMKTGFFGSTGMDTSNFMDPDLVAAKIWEHVLPVEPVVEGGGQARFSVDEVHLTRHSSGRIAADYGPRAPT